MPLRTKRTVVFATNAQDTHVLLPVSDLSDAELVVQFLRYPAIAQLTNNRSWEDVPNDGTVFFARQERCGYQIKHRKLGSSKKKQINRLIIKLRGPKSSRSLYYSSERDELDFSTPPADSCGQFKMSFESIANRTHGW